MGKLRPTTKVLRNRHNRSDLLAISLEIHIQAVWIFCTAAKTAVVSFADGLPGHDALSYQGIIIRQHYAKSGEVCPGLAVIGQPFMCISVFQVSHTDTR